MTYSIESAARRLLDIGTTASDHLAAQRRALETIREYLPYDVAAFSTVDPATLLWTSCVTQGIEPDPHRELFMFENEYRHDDLHKVSDVAKLPRPVARLSNVSRELLLQSPRYQAIQGVGVGDEMRIALVDEGNCWGSIELYRANHSGPFTERDELSAATLAQHLARMLRMSLLRQAASLPGSMEDPPGVLVLNQNGAVEAMSPGCEQWLEEAGTSGPIPSVVRSLATRFAAGEDDSFSTSVPSRSGGWLRLHATELRAEAGEKTTIVIEPVKPAILADSVARAYGFTRREREVITCVARGLSSKEVAVVLDISTYTVNDHIKSVLRKAGVQSRQQLIATLFFDHCLPLRQRDAIPGPYGWFLDA